MKKLLLNFIPVFCPGLTVLGLPVRFFRKTCPWSFHTATLHTLPGWGRAARNSEAFRSCIGNLNVWIVEQDRGSAKFFLNWVTLTESLASILDFLKEKNLGLSSNFKWETNNLITLWIRYYYCPHFVGEEASSGSVALWIVQQVFGLRSPIRDSVLFPDPLVLALAFSLAVVQEHEQKCQLWAKAKGRLGMHALQPCP